MLIKSSASTEYSHKDPPSIECVSVTDDLKPAVTLTHTDTRREREGPVVSRLCCVYLGQSDELECGHTGSGVCGTAAVFSQKATSQVLKELNLIINPHSFRWTPLVMRFGYKCN